MPANRNRIVFEGSLGVNAEQWSTGIVFQDPGLGQGESSDAVMAAWAQDIHLSFTGLVNTALRTALSTSGTIDRVRIEYYNGTGPLTSVVESSETPVAGLTTADQPYSSSVCLSLATGFTSSRRRGRMYWPALAAAVDGNGRFTGTTSNTQFAAAAVQLINMIKANYSGALDMEPGVYSTVDNDVTTVTAVRVGSIPDTQRRRRDNLVEVYATEPV